MNTLPIYFHLALASIRARMEYKASFFFYIFAIIFFYIGQLGLLFIIIMRFKSINGWTLGEIVFLYGLLTFAQGFATMFFSSMNNFDSMLVKGEFDRFLVRPLSPMGQVIFSKFEAATFAHFLLSVPALYYGSVHAGIEWTFSKAMFFPLAVAGAVLIHAAIRIFVSTVAFWTLRNTSLVHTVVFSSKEFIVYPINIYNTGVQIFLTFIFPIAFINFYPAHYFLDKSGELLLHPSLQLMTPVVGVALFAASIAAWRSGIDHYQSAGS